nr:reverse transcriptase domain-containing protein [Tanacetum cinerariifolium]
MEQKNIQDRIVLSINHHRAFIQVTTLFICYNDDDDEERSDSLDDNIISGLPSFSAITPDEPVLSIEGPDNSLSMGDEHLDTILATKSDEFIKSGVENLILILSESKGIPDHMCDVLSHDNSPPLDVSKDQIEDFSESNEEVSLTDDDSFSIDNIDYVKASPPNSELVSSEVMEIVILKVGGIEASNDNPIPFYDPVISGTPLNLTPSGESDFFLEVDAFLTVEDEFTSDRGTHFCNDQFAKVMLKFGVTHHLATLYHPQISGQLEVSNRGLKCIFERTVGENRASWLDKLDDALWAFRTAYKTPIGCTSYKLVYGKACHLPIELEHKAY